MHIHTFNYIMKVYTGNMALNLLAMHIIIGSASSQCSNFNNSHVFDFLRCHLAHVETLLIEPRAEGD